MPRGDYAPVGATGIVRLVGALLALASAGTASAQVLETATIASSYSYTVGSQQGANANAAGDERFVISDVTNGFASDLGLALTATLNDNGSFFFLHNAYCVGQCSATLDTAVTFTLTNLGTAPVDLRFDSLITPGHLSRSNFFGPSGSDGASFDFRVTQNFTTVVDGLYLAGGSVGAGLPIVSTSDGEGFNAQATNDNPPDWNVLDWSATNLSVNLSTLNAGQTRIVQYRSRLNVATSNPACLDTTSCLGYQAAFGDPRARGDPQLLAFADDFAALAEPTFPAVGALYDPFLVTYAFVPVGSPPPPPTQSFPPFDYDVPYRPIDAIPEPATWAMLLAGFAAVGGAARRRRGPAAALAGM